MSETVRRVLVTGSRTWRQASVIFDALDSAYTGAMIVVHGACPNGADVIADMWTRMRHRQGWNVAVERHPADWDTHGKKAGILRNGEMVAADIDLCLAFIRDNSPGASHCARIAEEAGITTQIFRGGKS